MGLSILPSVVLFLHPVSPGISWDWIIRFFEFWHGARNPYEVVGDRDFFTPKTGAMSQK